MLNSLLHVILAFAAAGLIQDPSAQTAMPLEETAGWAVQSGGRTKPLETHAREQILAVTGKKSIDGMSPLQFFWDFRFNAAELRTRDYIRVNNKELRTRSGLDVVQLRFSFDALMGNEGFQRVVMEAIGQERAGRSLDALHTDALRVYDKLQRTRDMIEGESLRVVAGPGPEAPWSSLESLADAADPQDKAVFEAYSRFTAAYQAGDSEGFTAAARQVGAGLRTLGGALYPDAEVLETEQRYNRLNAFGKAWALYLAGFLLFAFFGRSERRTGYRFAFMALSAGFLLHTYGIALRWQIAGRAPVSDMYESLVFMGWGILAIGIALEAFHRKSYFGLATALMGFLALAFAENLPLDSSISPLVPVLANTSWLSIHVMTIMIAYSAFALSLGIAHIVLVMQLFRPGRTESLRTLSALLYKTLQIGVLFLAAGIAFGAIWANESWGRYWGWDPKETWSLITFFVYMALIHARFAGWLNHFGLALSSIAGFQAVLMTYYGVNFILGTGLHSYGFSSGGLAFLLGYLGLEAAVVAAAVFRYRRAIAAVSATQPASMKSVPALALVAAALTGFSAASCGKAEGNDAAHLAPPSAVAAGNPQAKEPETFQVPPPPFKGEDIFPCSECHEPDFLTPNPERRDLTLAHDDIVLKHDEEHRWCLDCHDTENRDMLHLASGDLVPFEESYRLCGQCHGDKYRDWRVGVHGRRTGDWNGKKEYLLCVHCHDSHSPRFAPLEPEPAPTPPRRTK